MFSDYNGKQLGINNRKIMGDSLNTWELNNIPLHSRIKGKVSREIFLKYIYIYMKIKQC